MFSVDCLEKRLLTVLNMGVIVFVLGGLHVCSAQARGSMDPVALLKQIRTTGAETVFRNDLRGEKWLEFLKKVESGDKSWLEVAAAIYPATDGGPAADLTLVVGSALVRAPREVLLFAAPKLGVEGVCDYSEMTMGQRGIETRQQLIADIDARLKAVSKVSDPEASPSRDKCLQILRNAKLDILGPHGPFPSNVSK